MIKERHPFRLSVDELPAANWTAFYISIVTDLSINKSLAKMHVYTKMHEDNRYRSIENEDEWLYKQERKGMK